MNFRPPGDVNFERTPLQRKCNFIAPAAVLNRTMVICSSEIGLAAAQTLGGITHLSLFHGPVPPPLGRSVEAMETLSDAAGSRFYAEHPNTILAAHLSLFPASAGTDRSRLRRDEAWRPFLKIVCGLDGRDVEGVCGGPFHWGTSVVGESETASPTYLPSNSERNSMPKASPVGSRLVLSLEGCVYKQNSCRDKSIPFEHYPVKSIPFETTCSYEFRPPGDVNFERTPLQRKCNFIAPAAVLNRTMVICSSEIGLAAAQTLGGITHLSLFHGPVPPPPGRSVEAMETLSDAAGSR